MSLRRLMAGGVAILCVGAAACREAPTPRQRADAKIAGVDQALHEWLWVSRVPGVALARWEEGAVTLQQAGTRRPGQRSPVGASTVFPAASLSKPVFAFLVLQRVERGQLDLDAPLADVVPLPRLADPRGGAITARHVLSHGSGLPNWGKDSLELAFDPGDGFRYSGEGYVWLQRVVEQIAGEPLETLAQREIFEPLGMLRSSYVWREEFAEDVVDGLDRHGRLAELPRIEEANAAHSLLTTAEDYLLFVRAVVDGWGLQAETRDEMLTPQRPAVREGRGDRPGRLSWGLGWGLERAREGHALWHWGDNGAFKAFVLADPASDRAVVYFANGHEGLSFVDEVVGGLFAGRRDMMGWLGYESFRSNAFVWRHTLIEAFDESADVGHQALEAYGSGRTGPPDADVLRRVVDALEARDNMAGATAVTTFLDSL